MSAGTRKLPPAVVLFFLAPIVAELLSGSSPPAEFFKPFSLILLSVLYGGGAILCRELVRRWGKGWMSLLTLGSAYGILEEGLMVKSFFDPNWVDLGSLGAYGRALGVNWVWALELTIYHAVFSITIPVLLVELIYPERRAQAWIRPRAARWLAALVGLDVLVGFLFLTPYRPPLIPYALSIAVLIGLAVLARRVEDPIPASRAQELPRPHVFWLVGLLATIGFFIIAWVLPSTPLPVVLTVALAVALVLGAYRIVRRWVRRMGPMPSDRALALAAGALSFFILLAPLQELDRTRQDNTAGMAVVGLGAAGFLFWLRARLRRGAAAPSAGEARLVPLG